MSSVTKKLIKGAAVTQMSLSYHGLHYKVNVYNDAVARGWNGTSPLFLQITIDPSAVIGDNIIQLGGGVAYSMLISGFPLGSKIILNNYGVISGYGGYGASYGGGQGSPGGGPALQLGYYVTIYNYGIIQGGGGGGDCVSFYYAGSGGAGSPVGIPGTPAPGYPAANPGTLTTGGAAIAGPAGKGGDGGQPGGGGVAPGYYIIGNSLATWAVQGTVRGRIM